MGRYRTITSAILTAVAYDWAWPLIFFGLALLFSKPLAKKTLFIWGTVYMGILHLFLLNLADDSHILIAIFLWAFTSMVYGSVYGLGGLVMHAFKKNSHLWIPLIWGIIEWVKSSGSFGNPNGNLAFALSPIIHFLPIVSIIGQLGLSMIMVIVILETLSKKKRAAGLLVVIVVSMLTIRSGTPAPHQTPIINVVHTTVDQHVKQTVTAWPSLEEKYIRRIQSVESGVIIFPESIIPTDIRQRPFFSQLQTISTKKNTSILAGSFVEKTHNGSYFLSPAAPPIRYKKQRLMPFGEYLPLRSILSHIIPPNAMINDFQKGTGNITIPIGNIALRPIICLEAIYPQFYASPAPIIIAIMANQAWFNPSAAGNKLLKFATIHAAQSQTPVALASNYGISAIISANGNIVQKTRQPQVLSHTVTPFTHPSIHTKWPWAGPMIIVLAWLLYRKWNPS
jgi:apolipoprotein N-acyltransferase